jgi:hypothetical protein
VHQRDNDSRRCVQALVIQFLSSQERAVLAVLAEHRLLMVQHNYLRSMRRHGAKVLGRQAQAAISVEPHYPTRGDFLDQPFGVTRLMEVGPSLAAQPPSPAKAIAASNALNGALEFGIGAHRSSAPYGR